MASFREQINTSVASQAARVILEAEAKQRLSFPGAFLGREDPCAHAEGAVSQEVDPEVREVARSLHNRAKDTSACMHALRRLGDGIDAIEFPSGTSNAGTVAADKVREALSEAERAVDEVVVDFHMGLWQALPKEEALDRATSLLQCLDIRAHQIRSAKDSHSAWASYQDWYRAADLVTWWSKISPITFHQAGLKAEIHLCPPESTFEFIEFLSDED